MKIPVLIGSVLLVLVLAAAGFVIYSGNKTSQDKISTQSSTQDTEDIVRHPDMIGESVGSHHYLAYSNDTLNQTSDGKRVLFFYANWCPTCRPVDAEIEANSDKIPEDTTIIRVNYNDPDTDQDEKDLARKYNVTYQHTFVLIDENGNEVTKWNGGGLNEILSKL